MKVIQKWNLIKILYSTGFLFMCISLSLSLLISLLPPLRKTHTHADKTLIHAQRLSELNTVSGSCPDLTKEVCKCVCVSVHFTVSTSGYFDIT